MNHVGEPRDFRYVQNNGWNDYIYRKSIEPTDFSDQAYKRVYFFNCVEILESTIPYFTNLISNGTHTFTSPNDFARNVNLPVPGVKGEKISIDNRTAKRKKEDI